MQPSPPPPHQWDEFSKDRKYLNRFALAFPTLALGVSQPVGLAAAAQAEKRLGRSGLMSQPVRAHHSSGVLKWAIVLIYPDLLEPLNIL